MSELRIDHSRADAARRMKILELVGGNLDRAREIERWVVLGSVGDAVRWWSDPARDPSPPPQTGER